MLVRSIIILLLVLLIDLYVFQGIKLLAGGLSDTARKILYSVYWIVTAYAVFILVLNMFIDFRLWPKAFRVYSFAFVFITYFSKLFIVIFLLIDDFIRLIRWLVSLFYQKKNTETLPSGTGITRLEFLTKTGMVLASIPFFTMLYGIVRGPYRFEVRRMRLHLPKLPSAFNGLKVLQLSDIHIGSFSGREPLIKALKLIKKEQPDVILFTGDLVNDQTSETNDYLDLFKEIQAPMGVYSVLGNHDYGDYIQWPSKEEKQANLQRLKDVQKGFGWRLLMNEHVLLEKDGEKIGLIGIENWSSLGNFPKYGKMSEAVKDMPEVPVKILMSHDPTHWNSEVTQKYTDIDFTLAGHTHGLQFGIEIPGFRWSPAQYIYKQWAGLYQEGKQVLYVNRGFGFLGYPGRVGIMPEISVFELTNKA